MTQTALQTKSVPRSTEITLTEVIREALRHASWLEPGMFELMNVAGVQPLVKLLEKNEGPAGQEYYDTHAGRTTRLRWLVNPSKYRRLYREWMKHKGDLAMELTLRLPKGTK